MIAVPNPNKQEFIDHAKKADSLFKELGATRILECWGNDVPDGKLTDFRKTVQAKEDRARTTRMHRHKLRLRKASTSGWAECSP